MTEDFQEFDIVMFDKNSSYLKMDRNWIGYIYDPKVVYEQVAVRWWDDQTRRWTNAQNVPAESLELIGRVDV